LTLGLDVLSGDLELKTESFTLEPLRWADGPDLLAHFSDPEVTQWLDIEPLEDLEEAEGIVAWARTALAEERGVRWAIRDADGDFVGTCGFNAIILVRGSRGEIAYDLARPWWGQGVMAEIMPLILDFGFRRLGLRRLEALVTPGNERSCRLLERHGFQREGVLRDWGQWRGRFWDQIVYGRLSDI
jgi:ribosomal-protein-alanine N-acetyltransferase